MITRIIRDSGWFCELRRTCRDEFRQAALAIFKIFLNPGKEYDERDFRKDKLDFYIQQLAICSHDDPPRTVAIQAPQLVEGEHMQESAKETI